MATEAELAGLAERLEGLLRSDDVQDAIDLIASVHPADQADLYRRFDADARRAFLAVQSATGLAELLAYLDEDTRQELADEMPRAALARVLDAADNDIAVDVLRSLAPAEAARVLANMATAADITLLLPHPDESAGGLMTRGYVTLHRDMTAAEALTFLRLRHPTAEEAYYLFVLDAANRLEGVVNLRELIVAAPDARIEAIMTTEIITVGTETDQEEAARLLQRYRLRSLPVVDEGGVLSGIITVDDLIDVISEEATEDMYRMAGVGVKEHAFSPVHESVARRVPWLAFNMVWAFAAASIVNVFEGTIEQVAALAVFMPVIAGQGGNAGIQTATIVVRSMALGEVALGDLVRVLTKEWLLGVIKGTIFGLVLGTVAWAWKGNTTLGIVAGSAMFLNMLVAATAGVLIPMTLRRFGLDPATVAGVFDTMLTDVMGFLIFLGLATLLLSRLA